MSHRVSNDNPDPRLRFLRGGGNMGTLIRDFDWTRTSLGHPAHWPASLKTAVGIMLNSAAPVYIGWGASFIQLYNDGYRPVLGELKHPQALGLTTPETWHEIWDFVGPLFNGVMASGQAVSMENLQLTMLRNGYPEECFFTFSYSPLTDELGDIRGVIVTCLETTEKFVSVRRSECVKKLVEGLSQAVDTRAVGAVIEATVGAYPQDLPFGLWYDVRPDRSGLDLVAAGGITRGSALSPESLGPGCATFYAGLAELGQPLSADVAIGPDMLTWASAGPPDVLPNALCIQPLCCADYLHPDGYLMLAVNPMRPYDDAQKTFLKEVRVQIEEAVRRVRRSDYERRESRHQYQTIMDVVPCLVWMSDQDNECSFFNQAWLDFRGRTLEQETHGGWTAGVHPDDLDSVAARFLDAVATRSALTVEYRLLHAGGSYRWVLDQCTPRHSVLGVFLGYVGTCLDITESKETEIQLTHLAQLRQSEAARQTSILNALPAHIALLDPHGLILSVNEAWRRFGRANANRDPGFGIGLNYVEICARAQGDGADMAHRVADGIRSVLSGTVPSFSIEYGCNSPAQQRSFVLRAAPLAANGSLGAVVMHIDVSAELEAKQQLRLSESRFRQMAETIRDIFFLLDLADDSILYISPAYEDVWGRSCASLYAHPESWIESVHPEERESIRAQFRSGLAAGSFKMEYRIERPDGAIRYIEVRGFPVCAADGAPVRIAGVAKDMTERTHAAQELRASERRFRNMLQNVGLVSLMLDRDACITYCNEFMLVLTGWKYEEVIGRNWFELFAVPGVYDLKAGFAAFLACRPETWHGENEVVTRTGERRLISWNNSVLRSGTGEVVGTASIGEDITEQKRAQQEILSLNANLERRVADRTADLEQARNDANTANQAKSSFLATISHEIRTPMNGVLGMIDVLHRTGLTDYQGEMVELIRESAFSLLAILDDILDFSKIEAGRLDLERAPISVAAVVETACAIMDHLAAEKGVEFTLFIDPAIPDAVLGDALRLRQVLLNLLSNAIKFSSGRDQPGRVAVRALAIGRSSGQVSVQIQVTDNGIGIGAATRARLFTAFAQADSSTTRRFGGTGLGLVISRRLVELMGGALTFESALGKGASFSVGLPFALAPGAAAGARPGAELAGLRCLAVGAPQGLAGIVAAYLAHDGAQVEAAADLSQARALTAGSPPGPWIWIIDCTGIRSPLHELRALTDSLPLHQIRVVALRRGARRAPRLTYAGLVLADGNVLTRRRLANAVAIAAGRAADKQALPSRAARTAAIAAPSRDEAIGHGRLILVAEDNETNQKVILFQLELLGFAADLAANGREAFELWQRGSYAILLCDVHMPEMDGYELAGAIRAAEQGGARIPIIALTANTLKDEAARCRGAGMDDYLSKPLELSDLKETLETWLPATPGPADAQGDGVPPAAVPAVDVSVLERLIGEHPAVVLEFLNDFRVSATQIGKLLTAACIARRPDEVRAQAHKLKSSARTVGALALGDLCARIEASEDAQGQQQLLPKFERELEAVTACLDALNEPTTDRRLAP